MPRRGALRLLLGGAMAAMFAAAPAAESAAPLAPRLSAVPAAHAVSQSAPPAGAPPEQAVAAPPATAPAGPEPAAAFPAGTDPAAAPAGPAVSAAEAGPDWSGRAWCRLGLGVDGETGRPFSVEALSRFAAAYGPFAARFGWATAVGINLVDRLGLDLSWSFRPAAWFGGELYGLYRWRNYGQAGWEHRIGLALEAELGSDGQTMGCAAVLQAGYSTLATAVPSLGLSWVDRDPLFGAGVAWYSGTGWRLALILSDYHLEDASLYLKTFFCLSVDYRRPGFALGGELALKYSDFFTLTGYLDGAALRLYAELPLAGDLP